MELSLPKPHETQQQVIDCSTRFIVLLCGRRWGKSQVSQDISIRNIIGQKRVAYITPTYQLASVFFDNIVQLGGSIFKTNRTELTIKYGQGELRFFTGENIDGMRGG